MRFSIVAVLATLSSLAVAQDVLGSLPKCGQDCFGNKLGNCAQLDFACVCGNVNLISELSCCVATTCSQQDQDSIITLASSLCKAYGVDVPTQASCASGASSAPASTASSSASGSASASGSGASTTPAPSETSASGSAAAASESTEAPGAAATAGAGLGLAMGLAGLLVAL